MPELLSAGDYDAAVTGAETFPDHYLTELVHQARQQGLASHPVWHTLMHYKENFWGGYTSQVDGADFFLSRDGKTEPQAELAATLAAFFSEVTIPPNNLTPQCRFRARYYWLAKQLQFDQARLPQNSCSTFDNYMKTLNPASLTVVFPASHPNSPSSMFGHTLIRIDGKGQTEATRMLDYTLNYAAQSEGEAGFSYAIKGLSGGFYGRFAAIPYYLKLREYAQMENRDLWEYRLNLDEERIRFILMHAWELLPTFFDYYFFTENCSYHLLSLLELEQEGEPLTDQYTWWVLPIATLKQMSQQGMIADVNYHPSNYRVIQARRRMLSEAENELAFAIYQESLDRHSERLQKLSLEQQARVLDLVYDYVRYKKIASNKRLDAELSEREREILLRRSRLGIASEPPRVAAPHYRPEQGHGTTRADIGIGADDLGEYLSLGWRAVYHDFLDPSPAYANNFTLEFGKLGARYYRYDGSDDHKLRLDHFYLINLVNMEPRDDFFGLISWRVITGWEAVSRAQNNYKLGYVVRGGPALSYRPWGERALLYTVLDLEAAYASVFEHDYLFAAGISAGTVLNASGIWKLNLEGSYLEALAGDSRDNISVSLEQSWMINKDLSFRLGVKRYQRLDRWDTEGNAAIYVYF